MKIRELWCTVWRVSRAAVGAPSLVLPPSENWKTINWNAARSTLQNVRLIRAFYLIIQCHRATFSSPENIFTQFLKSVFLSAIAKHYISLSYHPPSKTYSFLTNHSSAMGKPSRSWKFSYNKRTYSGRFIIRVTHSVRFSQQFYVSLAQLIKVAYSRTSNLMPGLATRTVFPTLRTMSINRNWNTGAPCSKHKTFSFPRRQFTKLKRRA